MKIKPVSTRWFWLLVMLLCLGATAATARAEMKLEAQLIWGTSDDVTADPLHKPVDADVAAKLKSLHLQWKNFFVVESKQFTVAKDDTQSAKLSKDCEVKVKNLGHGDVEMTILGRGKEIGKIKQSLPKGELLVTGGNAENSTAWFVALKQLE